MKPMVVRCPPRLCIDCHESYTPTSLNQKRCPACTNYGAKYVKNMSLRLQGYAERIKKELDKTVIHLDPVAYSMGIRRVLNA